MSTPDETAGAQGAPVLSRVTVTHRVRRRLGDRYWVAAVAVPVLLTAAAGLTRGPAIEDSLENAALAALQDADLPNVKVTVEGRQVTAYVPTGDGQAKVRKALESVTGIGDIDMSPIAANAAEERACRDLQDKLDRATNGRRIPFAGSTPNLTAEGESMVRAAAGLLRACPPAVVVVAGHVDSVTLNGSDLSLARANVITDLLVANGVKVGRILPRGYADQYPVASNETAAGRAQNQRGSIIVERQ